MPSYLEKANSILAKRGTSSMSFSDKADRILAKRGTSSMSFSDKADRILADRQSAKPSLMDKFKTGASAYFKEAQPAFKTAVRFPREMLTGKGGDIPVEEFEKVKTMPWSDVIREAHPGYAETKLGKTTIGQLLPQAAGELLEFGTKPSTYIAAGAAPAIGKKFAASGPGQRFIRRQLPTLGKGLIKPTTQEAEVAAKSVLDKVRAPAARLEPKAARPIRPVTQKPQAAPAAGDEYIYHGTGEFGAYKIPKEGIKEGQWFGNFKDAKSFAWGKDKGGGKIFAVKKNKIRPIAPDKNDIFGQEFQKAGVKWIRGGNKIDPSDIIEVTKPIGGDEMLGPIRVADGKEAIKKLLIDVNKVVGKAGAWGAKRSKEQKDAATRIVNQHLPELKRAAAQQGKELLVFLKEQGLDDATIRAITSESGQMLGSLRVAKTPAKVKKPLQKLAAKEPDLFRKQAISKELRRSTLLTPESIEAGEAVIKAGPGGLTAASDYERASFNKLLVDNPELGGDISAIMEKAGRVLGLQSEGGRLLESNKHVAAIGKTTIDILKTRLKQAKTPTDVEGYQTILKAISENNMIKPGALDYALELWTSGLLSNPDTMIRNLVGNITAAVSGPIDKFTASLISKVPGVKGKVKLGEAPIEVMTHIKRLPQTLRVLGANIASEDPQALNVWANKILAKPDIKAGTRFTLGRIKALTQDIIPKTMRVGEAAGRKAGVIPGKLGKFIRAPFRALKATDEAGFFTNYEAQVAALKHRYGTSKSLAVIESEAAEDALYKIFQGKLGEGAGSIQKGLNKYKAGKFVVPFFKTLVKLTQWTYEHSPLSFIGQAIKTPTKGIDAMTAAKAVNGTVALALTYQWLKANKVKIIPAAKTKQERASLYRRGLQESALLFPDGTTKTYRNLQPVSDYFATIAMVENIKSDLKEGAPRDKAIGEAAERFIKGRLNESIATGPKRAIDAVFDPAKRGAPYVNQFIASWIPQLSGKATRLKDPYVREVEPGFGRGTKESIMAKIPGLSEKLPVKLDVFGKPIKRAPETFTPFKPTKFKYDLVEEELARLKIFPGEPRRKQKGIAITAAERREAVSSAGPKTKKYLDDIVRSSGYKSSSDEIKSKILKAIVRNPLRAEEIRKILKKKYEDATTKERKEMDWLRSRN